MVSTDLLIVAVAATLVVADQPSTRPPQLPIVPGAEVNAPITERRVEYDVKEPFPAPNAIAYLVEVLAKQGWKLVELGSFRQGLGPNEVPTIRSAIRRTHTWEGRWQNAAADEITFHLAYECPMEDRDMHSMYVHVVGSWYTKEAATRRDAERKRQLVATCAFLRDKAPAKARGICPE